VCGGEERVTALLVSLAEAGSLLTLRAATLNRLPEWSGVTSVLEPCAWDEGEDGARHGLWGYVDGLLDGVGGVTWMVDVIRDGATGWSVERALRTNVATPEEALHDLPTSSFPDTAALSSALPRLVNELLELSPR
jgi:hypothetical protein